MAKNEATLTFTGDTDKLERKVKGLGGRLRSALGGIGKAVAKEPITSGLGLAGAGLAVISFAKSSIAAFTEAQESQQRLTDAFARFPQLADTNADALRGLNTELARKTKFDDDAFASGQAVLAQFNLTGKQLTQVTPLLADYAAKTGRELPDAAGNLGKAFAGNARALKELGINYKSTGDQTKDVANITQLLRDKVGGFAEQQGKTAAGQAAILGNRFGEVKETIGEKLVPVLLRMSAILVKVIGFIEKNSKVLGPLAAIIGIVVAAQWAWNLAMTANPIGLVIVAVAALIAIIVIIATRTNWFQTIWRVAWGNVKAVALGVWNWLKGIPGAIVGVFRGLANGITAPFRAAFNFIADAWNNTIGSLSFSIPSWVPGIGGNGFDVPNMPHFHSGGVVPGPPGANVVAMLQAGETVIPAGRGGMVTVQLTLDGKQLAELLIDPIAGRVRRRGGQAALLGIA